MRSSASQANRPSRRRLRQLSTRAELAAPPPVCRAPPGSRIAYMTDVEGSWQFWNRYIGMSRVLSRDSGPSGALRLEDGAYFVYGGDVTDRGPGDIRVQRELIELQRRYPSRVHLILGNRDLNKLRLLSELCDEHVESSAVYWRRDTPWRAPPGGATKSRLAHRLRWMLRKTMGCPNTFEFRREELAALSNASPTDVTDQDVFDDFAASVAAGGRQWEYLERGNIAVALNDVLFVHGAVCELSLGFVPEGGGTRGFPSGREYGEDIESWCNALRDFKRAELSELAEVRAAGALSDHVWSESGGYDNPAAAGRLMQFGMNTLPSRKRTRTVVYNDFLRNGHAEVPPQAVTAPLAAAGIRRVVTGHKPHGDAPVVIKSGNGVVVVTADTSYSNNVLWDVQGSDAGVQSILDAPVEMPPEALGTPRGIAAAEVMFTVGQDGTTEVETHGMLSNGMPFAAAPADPGDGGCVVGRETADGWWIKAQVFPDGRESGPSDDPLWLISRATGFEVTNRIARTSQLRLEQAK